MKFQLEYHRPVQRWIPASVALFGLLALPVFLVSRSQAQINGAPASVTSPGFGGHAINGTPASVTSLGRGGFAPPNGGVSFGSVPFGAPVPMRGDGVHADGNRPHHHHGDHDRDRNFGYPYGAVYAVPYPYLVDNGSPEADDDSDEYQGGPTVFDRRGSGPDSYIPPAQEVPAAHAGSGNPALDAEPPQPPTTLIFKDGHQMEVGNYAIVGVTLYDLTPGHQRKIALAELDLPATEKQNDDHGVSFQLPPGAQAN